MNSKKNRAKWRRKQLNELETQTNAQAEEGVNERPDEQTDSWMTELTMERSYERSQAKTNE